MNEPTTPRLEHSIREHLAPLLREDGFGGTGRTYRRTVNGWVQILNVQGSKYGDAFAVNLAIHPVAVPDCIGRTVDPKKLTHDACELRQRLSEDGEDQWWAHFGERESMDEAVRCAASVYATHGRALLHRLAGNPSPLDTFTPDQLVNSMSDLAGFKAPAGRVALLFARVRRLEGRAQEAAGFVERGKVLAANAGLLLQDLNAVFATNDA